jgi:hypothetical protein
MKTIYDTNKHKKFDYEISRLKNEIVLQKIAKQQFKDHFNKQLTCITNVLSDSIMLNEGTGLSKLFNLPAQQNIKVLQRWVSDYLVHHESCIYSCSIELMIKDFKSEIAIRQQDFYQN